MTAPAKDLSPLEMWLYYGVDVQRRRVMLHGDMYLDVNEGIHSGIEYTVRNLLWLDALSEEPIELWLNTEGGNPIEAWAITDVMQALHSPVMTVGHGCVCSAGCLILASGTATRYVTQSCWFMWHQGASSQTGLPFTDSQHRSQWEAREMKRWVTAMTNATKKRYAYWESKAKGELWLNAREMIEHGIADALWD